MRKRDDHVLKRKIIIEYEMYYSDAFRSLSKTAILVLCRFLQKRTWDPKKKAPTCYNHYDNGGLSFPYSEARDLGISDRQFTRALDQLCELGFIEQDYQGGALGNRRDYSRFTYVETWRSYGCREKFKPKPRKRAIRYSKGFDEYNAKKARGKKKATAKNDCDSQTKEHVKPQSKKTVAG